MTKWSHIRSFPKYDKSMKNCLNWKICLLLSILLNGIAFFHLLRSHHFTISDLVAAKLFLKKFLSRIFLLFLQERIFFLWTIVSALKVMVFRQFYFMSHLFDLISKKFLELLCLNRCTITLPYFEILLDLEIRYTL